MGIHVALGAIAKGIAGFFGGDTGKEIVGFIRDRFPGKMSEADLAEVAADTDRRAMERERNAMQWATEQDAQFQKFTTDMEGTASDLKDVPFLGPIVIFFRGMFRPVFSYFVMYLDFVWFVGETAFNEQQQTAMIVINLIVLVFFFGERAVKNLAPLIARVFGGNLPPAGATP